MAKSAHPIKIELAERWHSIRWSAGHSNKSIYAFFPEETYANDTGLYVSTDDGETWNKATMRGIEGRICDLAAHPTSSEILSLTTSVGVYLSKDAGEHFAKICDWGGSYVAFDMFSPNLMYYAGQQYMINDNDWSKEKRYNFWQHLILSTITFCIMLITGMSLIEI